jgi:hypothetical protein
MLALLCNARVNLIQKCKGIKHDFQWSSIPLIDGNILLRLCIEQRTEESIVPIRLYGHYPMLSDGGQVMSHYSVHYHFTQRFQVPARRAYEWCTDYDPGDPALMHENAVRGVQQVSESTIILTDLYRVGGSSIRKQKLVNLYPDNLSWTSTHLIGPNKYSQFLYEIVAEGKEASRLEFNGLHLERGRTENKGEKGNELSASRLRDADAAAWRLLAAEMEKELRPH